MVTGRQKSSASTTLCHKGEYTSTQILKLDNWFNMKVLYCTCNLDKKQQKWSFVFVVLVHTLISLILIPKRKTLVRLQWGVKTHESEDTVNIWNRTHESEMISGIRNQVKVTIAAQDMDSNTSDKGCSFNNAVMKRACGSDVRANVLKAKCKAVNGSVFDMSKAQKKLIMTNIYVDLKHKIVACLPPKSGCTTWKAILANNSGPNVTLPKNLMALHSYPYLHKYGIYRLNSLPEYELKQILASKNYLKFMIARHPFERLYSAYADKVEPIMDKVRIANRHVNNILKLFHKDLSQDQAPTFQEFIQYLRTPKSTNWHWEPIYNICQPCLINYDLVLKTETLDRDNDRIIKRRLKPYHRGERTAANVQGGKCPMETLLSEGKKMEIYKSVKDVDFQSLVEKYKSDLEFFGYSFKRNNGSVDTLCSLDDQNNGCC